MNVACTNLEPKSKAVQVRVRRPSRRLRVGFVPVNDCAPYVVAAEYNLFRKYGLEVELCREKGWNVVRD
jgi:nitrate/nitrite transport system substrate-binding protein